MIHQVRISARAKRDVDEALGSLVGRAPQGAARWHAALLNKIQTLEDNPTQWPLADTTEQLGVELRQLLFGKRRNVFRILFTVDGEIINVHHIWRATRDWLQPGDL